MKTIQGRIGVKAVGGALTATSCRARAALIRKMVEKNGLKGVKRAKLLNQAAWYAWKAKQLGKPARKAKA